MARPARVAASASAVGSLGRAAAPDLLQAVDDWQAWLKVERRASPHTLAAYTQDLDGFLAFLAGRRARPVVDTRDVQAHRPRTPVMGEADQAATG